MSNNTPLLGRNSEATMLKKCERCHGKGGWVRIGRNLLTHVFVECVQCKGKGKWWTNNRPKRQKASR